MGNRNSNWDFYIQDDWKVNNRLTLNLGLRYDYNTVWTTGANQGQNFDVATQALLPLNQKAYSAPKGDWAPRVGFAWDPNGRGKTVVHGYAGLFYNPMHFNFATTTNVPALASYNVNVFQAIFANPPFSIDYPAPNPPLIAGTQNVNAFPQNPKDPVATNWLFDIQQEVARGTILTLSYVGNNVHHMQSGVDFAALNANPANVFTQARQYSGFANEDVLADATRFPLQFPASEGDPQGWKAGSCRRTIRGLTKSTICSTFSAPALRTRTLPPTIAAAGIGTCGTISLAARSTACPI